MFQVMRKVNPVHIFARKIKNIINYDKKNKILQALATAARSSDKQRDASIVEKVKANEKFDPLSASSSGSAGSNKENRLEQGLCVY